MKSMPWKVILMLCIMPLILSGCGMFMTPPVVKIPIGAAAIGYGDFKYLQAVVTVRATDLCKANKLSESDCQWLKSEGEKIAMLDKDIRKSILDAKGEVDQEKIMQYLQILAGLAVKVGGF